VAVSEQNAIVFTNAPHLGLQQNIRRALKKGHGKVVHDHDRTDWSSQVLRRFKSQLRLERPLVTKMADDVGLGREHTVIYGFLSMQSHGTTFGLPEDPSEPRWMASLVASE